MSLSDSCGRKIFGCDIEYDLGGDVSLGHYMQKAYGFKDSDEDGSGDVIEHRPQPQNDINLLIKEVDCYYKTLHKAIKEIFGPIKKQSSPIKYYLKYLMDNGDLEFNGEPEILFDGSPVGLHMHLHILESDSERVIKLLDLLAMWHNIKNRNLWSERLENGYGGISTSEDGDCVRTEVDWHCHVPTHACIEYRAFNSGTPKKLSKVLKAVSVIVENKNIVCDKNLSDISSNCSDNKLLSVAKLYKNQISKFLNSEGVIQ